MPDYADIQARIERIERLTGIGEPFRPERSMQALPPGMYQRWLSTHLAAGGTVTHSYDYPSTRWDWYYATRDVTVEPAYGARSYNIVAAPGVTVNGDPGHTSVFHFDKVGPIHIGMAPAFSDTSVKTEVSP